MTSFRQAKHVAVVATCILATCLATGPTAAQQPDSATINGTIGSPVYGDHTWTLTLQGLSYSYYYWYHSESNWRAVTSVYANGARLARNDSARGMTGRGMRRAVPTKKTPR